MLSASRICCTSSNSSASKVYSLTFQRFRITEHYVLPNRIDIIFNIVQRRLRRRQMYRTHRVAAATTAHSCSHSPASAACTTWHSRHSVLS